MTKNGRGKAAARRSGRKKSSVEAKAIGERYTPLLSCEQFTFSRMRINRGGPRSYSAICLPGWVRA
jgi:hypothetical protein